jgi:hypothetical protein
MAVDQLDGRVSTCPCVAHRRTGWEFFPASKPTQRHVHLSEPQIGTNTVHPPRCGPLYVRNRCGSDAGCVKVVCIDHQFWAGPILGRRREYHGAATDCGSLPITNSYLLPGSAHLEILCGEGLSRNSSVPVRRQLDVARSDKRQLEYTMTTAVVRSLRLDQDLVIVKLDGRSAEIALRVHDTDRATVAKLFRGQRIEFDFECDRDGRVFAVDLAPVSSLSVSENLKVSLRQPKSRTETGASTAPNSADPGGALEQPDYATQSQYAAVEELLSAPVIRRLMKRDGVSPDLIRRLIDRIARQPQKPE